MTVKTFLTAKLCFCYTLISQRPSRQGVGREEDISGELVKGVLKKGDNRDEGKRVEGAR